MFKATLQMLVPRLMMLDVRLQVSVNEHAADQAYVVI